MSTVASRTAATRSKHECARCGKNGYAETLVFSRHTRARYCRDFKACDRRVKRRGL